MVLFCYVGHRTEEDLVVFTHFDSYSLLAVVLCLFNYRNVFI